MDAEKLWRRFMLLLDIDTFGEEGVIGEGKKGKNLLGSVEKHKRFFMQACADLHLLDAAHITKRKEKRR